MTRLFGQYTSSNILINAHKRAENGKLLARVLYREDENNRLKSAPTRSKIYGVIVIHAVFLFQGKNPIVGRNFALVVVDERRCSLTHFTL